MEKAGKTAWRFLTLSVLVCLLLTSGVVVSAGGDGAMEKTKAATGLALDPIFNDHMVIQREKPITINGTCTAADSVTVSFGGKTATSTVKNGAFTATLPAMKANTTGQALTVTAGSATLTLEDVLIGDVWFCSGQSNMQFTVKELTKKYRELYTAIQDNTLVRHFFVPIGHKTTPQEGFLEDNTYWSVPTATEIQNYSAYAFSFAACVQKATGVPVGIINCACGGTQIQHWLSKEAQKLAGITFGENFFNAMVNPLAGIAVKGVLWYQGESNINLPDSYTKLFDAYVKTTREFFGDENLPFITTQLPRYTANEYPKWPQFRLEQWAIAEKMDNVEIVCGIDTGVPTFNIHPSDKFLYGTRAGELALNKVYGMDTPGPSAYPSSITRDKDGILVKFSNAESGLEIQGSRLQELRMVKKDGSSVTATGEVVNGNALRITNATADVVKLTYCMSTIPEGTLFTKNGLPVAPFELEVQENTPTTTTSKTEKSTETKKPTSGTSAGTGTKPTATSGTASTVTTGSTTGTEPSVTDGPTGGIATTTQLQESTLGADGSTTASTPAVGTTGTQDSDDDKPVGASPLVWVALGVGVLAVVGGGVFLLKKKR